MKVIMNPPYNGSLHLKILREALKHSDDIVNLSPIRWLEDPLAEYKQGSDFKTFEDIREHIESLDTIDRFYAHNVFSASFVSDLGIYCLRGKQKEAFSIKNTIVDKVMKKIIDKKDPTKSLFDVLDTNKIKGWRVRLSEMRPIPAHTTTSNVTKSFTYYTTHCLLSWVYKDGYTKDNVYWTDHNIRKGTRDKSKVGDPFPYSISFKNEQEAINFENSTKTKFYKYYVFSVKKDAHYPFKGVPFMPTYTHPWTDADLYAYFGLTADEIDIIEKEMANKTK